MESHDKLFAIYPVYQDKGPRTDYRFICFPCGASTPNLLQSLRNDKEAYLLFCDQTRTLLGTYHKTCAAYYDAKDAQPHEEESRLLCLSMNSETITPYMWRVWEYCLRNIKTHMLFQLINVMTKIGLKASYAYQRQEIEIDETFAYCDKKLSAFLHAHYDLNKFYREISSVCLYHDDDEDRFRNMYYSCPSLFDGILPLEIITKS